MARTKLSSSRLDLVTLRVLVAAIEEGNLARAAERENISISGVSRRITELEQRWGVQLLHRHDRGVRPTAAASSILDRLRQVFALLDDVVDGIGEVGAGVRGVIRVRANMTAVAGDLASYIAQFSTTHPEVAVELDETTTLDIIHAVRVGLCDVGIISGTVETEGLHLIPWIEDELVAILPLGHALALKPSLRFEDFLDHPFISMQHDSALQMLYRARSAELGRELDVRAHVSSFEAARKLVAAGCGVAILPGVAVPAENDRAVAIRTLDEAWARRQVMLCLRSAQLTTLLRTFVDFLCGPPASPPNA